MKDLRNAQDHVQNSVLSLEERRQDRREVQKMYVGSAAVLSGRVDLDHRVQATGFRRRLTASQNLLAFVPYGLLLHVLWEEKPLFQQILPIVCTSLLFELLQFLFAIGGTDITDLITNSCGGCLGIFLAIGLSRLSGRHWRTILNTVCLTGAVLLSALLAVVFAVN